MHCKVKFKKNCYYTFSGQLHNFLLWNESFNGMKAVEIHYIYFNKTFDTVFSCYWKVLTAYAHCFQGTLISNRCLTLVPLLTTITLTILFIILKPSVWAKRILTLARQWQEEKAQFNTHHTTKNISKLQQMTRRPRWAGRQNTDYMRKGCTTDLSHSGEERSMRLHPALFSCLSTSWRGHRQALLTASH